MKKLKGQIAIMLAVVAACSAIVACKGGGTNTSSGESSTDNVTIGNIVKNSQSDYRILIPKDAQKKELLAAQELQTFFEEATDIYLPIDEDANVSYSESAEYFSIGETTFAKELHIEATQKELGQQGFLQKTVGNSMIFLGATEYGTLYSVYDYLEEEFHYNYFNANAYYIDRQVKDVPLRDYDEKEKPDIGSFAPNYGTLAVGDEANVHDRYRMTAREFSVMKINDTVSVHNNLLILRINTHMDHPDWYTNWEGWKEDPSVLNEYADSSHIPENLCLTAHGNKEEYKEMVQAFCEEIYDEFKAGSTATSMIFGQMDGVATCDCEACTAEISKYGTKSVLGILFANDVLAEIYEWFETEEGTSYKRDFYVNVLAYLDFESAPVTYDEATDSFSLNNGLFVHDKVGFVMAPIKYDFGMLSTDTKNKSMYQNMRAWMYLGNSCMFYTYDFNTRHYLAPYESMTAKQELYRLMKEANCLHLYDQGQWTNAGLATGWSLLKVYVESKLRWNVDLDVNSLIYDYFYGVYGEAADIMYNMYWSYRTHWTEVREKAAIGADGIQINWVNYLSGNLKRTELWPYGLLSGWLEDYEKAFAAIEPLKKSNPSQYAAIERNLCAERVSTTYLLLALYSERYTKTEQEQLISVLENDSLFTKITLLAESGGATIDSFIAELRSKV